MSLRKITCLLLALCFVFSFVGCGKQNPSTDNSNQDSSIKDTSSYALNQLTGEKTLSPNNKNKRPIAIMVNNVSVAQPVQTGVAKADLVFETEVEGGITRLLAVYADPSDVGTIGTIRSARLVYADIANGLGAFYVHHGIDYTYCDPHIKANGIIHGNIGSPYAERQSNGLASEHTLYTNGANLVKYLKSCGYDAEVTVKPFASFATSDIAPSNSGASFVRVSFSTSYATDFIYNDTAKKYTRAKNNSPLKDYTTGETAEFKNVFVLKTSMSYYSDNYHRSIDLTGGSGYYISNGKYEEIKWSKGASSNSFKFTKLDGTELAVNPGNSYICITKAENKITINQ